MRAGGIIGWLPAAANAAAVGMPVSTHLCPEVACPGARARDVVQGAGITAVITGGDRRSLDPMSGGAA